MEKLKQFNLVNFLMEAVEQDRAVMVEMSTGNHVFGTVQLIDQVGPYPTVQIWRGKDDAPVICILAHIVTIGWQEPDDIHKSKKRVKDDIGTLKLEGGGTVAFEE